MAALFALKYEDPFEEIVREASDERLEKMLIACLRFGENEKAEIIRKEMQDRRDKNDKN